MRAASSGFHGQAEIHLFLCRVHLGDLNLQLVTETNNPARAAADELIALFVVNIKVVLHGGQGHEAAHGQSGDIHKETEVAQVRDQGWIMQRLAGRELRLEERKQFHVLAVALGIAGIAFRA